MQSSTLVHTVDNLSRLTALNGVAVDRDNTDNLDGLDGDPGNRSAFAALRASG